LPQRLKSVRENWYRSYGARVLFPLSPALTCRAITCRRFAAGFWWRLFHRSPRNPVLTYTLKPPSILSFCGTAEAVPFPNVSAPGG